MPGISLTGSGGTTGAALTSTITQTAHGFSVGNWLRYNGTAYVKAEADVAADADVDGVVQAVTDANTFVLQTGGLIATLSGLVAGNDYFLDPATAGAITATEPSTAGQVSKPVLHATSTTGGWIQNLRGLVIPAASITYKTVKLVDDATNLTVGLGKYGFAIDADLAGKSLIEVKANCTVAPTGSAVQFQVRKGGTKSAGGTNALSTACSIDTTKFTSDASAVQPVIKSDGTQTFALNALCWIDCAQADSNAISAGSEIKLGFQ